MLSRVGRFLPRVARRNFSKYIEEEYGKTYHRLAVRPEVEISISEVTAYIVGAILLLGDVSIIFCNAGGWPLKSNVWKTKNRFLKILFLIIIKSPGRLV